MTARPAALHAIAGVLIALAGIAVLWFSHPQRITHDQIVHGTFIAKLNDPAAFQNDYLYDERANLHNNFFVYRVLRWFSQELGSQELVYWLSLPVLFIVFALGMYALVWRVTRSWVASLATAFVANVHIPYIFMSSWGLPGPSEVGPREFFTMFLPWMALAFLVGFERRDDRYLAAVFFAAGLLGTVHLISAFNLVPVLLLAILVLEGWSWRTLRRLALFAFLALLGVAPYLAEYSRYVHLAPRGFVVPDPGEYAQAVMLVAPHTLPLGHWNMLWQWAVRQWWQTWPLAAIFAIVLWRSRRDQKPVDRFMGVFAGSVIAVNVAISATQWVRWYLFGRMPFFQIPRGMHFLYLPFFLAAGILFAGAVRWARELLEDRRWRRALAVAGVGALAVGVFAGPAAVVRYRERSAPAFSYRTCDDGPYRAIRQFSRPGDVLLVDPSAFSVVRACTGRAVVVLQRDGGVAYSLGADRLLAWFRRYQTVSAVFREAPERLPELARAYGARFVLSRTCAPVAGAVLRYRHPSQLNCVYQVGPSL